MVEEEAKASSVEDGSEEIVWEVVEGRSHLQLRRQTHVAGLVDTLEAVLLFSTKGGMGCKSWLYSVRRQYRPSELEVVVALAADIYSHWRAVKDKDSLIRKVRVANLFLHDPALGRCSRLDLRLFVNCHSGGLRAMRREAVLSGVQECLIVPTMSVDERWSLSGLHNVGRWQASKPLAVTGAARWVRCS